MKNITLIMNKLIANITLFFCLFFLCVCRPAMAADIVISKGGAIKTPIDISGLIVGDDNDGLLFKRTLEKDLVLSGWFIISEPLKGIVALSGTRQFGESSFSLPCCVKNTANNRVFLNKKYKDEGNGIKALAHRLADDIVMAVRGVFGIATTKITMVGGRTGQKDIYICDFDGDNLQRITRDNVVCLSPKWSIDGSGILYTSFKSGYPDVYLLDLKGMKRRRISGFAGLNSGAAMSPDKNWVALTLSKDGNPELYKINLINSQTIRLTRTRYASEASPSWSPDGKQIVFVSDQGGTPQLYVISSDGSAPQRITFKGGQNVDPDWGPDGRIVCSRLWGGKYGIVVLDMGGTEIAITSDDANYEDPSWAPDARHIICSRSINYISELYVLDTMGDAPLRFPLSFGEWKSPDWSPVNY